MRRRLYCRDEKERMVLYCGREDTAVMRMRRCCFDEEKMLLR